MKRGSGGLLRLNDKSDKHLPQRRRIRRQRSLPDTISETTMDFHYWLVAHRKLFKLSRSRPPLVDHFLYLIEATARKKKRLFIFNNNACINVLAYYYVLHTYH
ncbi:GSCOCG00000724001-RA-CDS [Cotesia congregata]|nr:GSCOCG00000724001-RA-CDS [Cotesia congregata]